MEMIAATSQIQAPLRPGEHREPIVVALCADDRELFVSECGAACISPERAYPLVIERRLLLDDAAAAGFDISDVAAILNAAGRQATTEVALDGPSSSYLRSFARPAATVVATSKFLATVPVRLYARAVTVEAQAAIECGAVAEAIAWERASVAAGRTLAEWAFLTILRSELEATVSMGSDGSGRRANS